LRTKKTWLLGIVFLLFPAGPIRAAGEGRIRVEIGLCALEAPPEARIQLEALARRAASLLPRIEAELDVRPAAPYRIVLIPPGPTGDREIAALQRAAPSWAAGFLLPGRRVGAIRIALADGYPYADVASVLAHESTHMLLHDAVAGELPRWFGEGVATAVEREWGMRDVLVYSSSLLTGALPGLADLDAAFDSGDDRARTAYAASFDFILWTVRRFGDGVIRRILEEAARRPFAEAWQSATGASLSQSEADWRRGSLLLYRIVPALTGSTVLWIGITFLALAAGARRRARSRRLLQSWEAEERAASAGDEDETMR
jgi:peptidase MA superfamily protein